MAVIEIVNLEKAYPSSFGTRRIPVLKGINLSVESGEIYGFLGPNGAGKTTTIKCILGLLRPDSGEIRLLGESSHSLVSRKRLGFLPEQPNFYDYLSIRELLDFTARLFTIPKLQRRRKVEEVIHLVGLEGRAETKLRKCSKGMLQRAGLAQALVNDPQVLILDEPFSGLDPVGRKELRDLVLSLKQSGRTIFFSSHILQDMELMVDRVAIIFNGKIVREGNLSDLVTHSVKHYELVFSGISAQEITRAGLRAVPRKDRFLARAEKVETVNRMIRTIHELNGSVLSVNPVVLTLEDIFLEEIGR